jgi:hypothetical protein
MQPHVIVGPIVWLAAGGLTVKLRFAAVHDKVADDVDVNRFVPERDVRIAQIAQEKGGAHAHQHDDQHEPRSNPVRPACNDRGTCWSV